MTREPHDALGLGPDATAEEIAQAYRELAKRFHPDLAGDDAEPRMQEINAAYDLLRDGLADDQRDRLGRRPTDPPTPAATVAGPGAWLEPAVRRRLGRELLATLEPGEMVLMTADACTWDSHDVRLAVTDRRLLWLRDDAISDRVRYRRWTRMRSVDGEVRRRLRRTGRMHVQTDGGRRLSFGELTPERLEVLLATVRSLIDGAAPQAQATSGTGS